jgi:hypothetical protein
MAREASLRQYNGGDSNVPSLVLDVYLGWEGVREKLINKINTKKTLQVIRRVSPIR